MRVDMLNQQLAWASYLAFGDTQRLHTCVAGNGRREAGLQLRAAGCANGEGVHMPDLPGDHQPGDVADDCTASAL